MQSESVEPEGDAVLNPDEDALLSRLRLIEDQGLETRAEAFANLYEQLLHRLEGGDQPA